MFCRSSKKIFICRKLQSCRHLLNFKHNYFITNAFILQQKEKNEEFNRENFVTFDKMIESRRQQASKTAIIEVDPNIQANHVISYCGRYGNIIEFFEYTNDKYKKFVIEYKDQQYLQDLIKFHSSDNDGYIPINLPFIKLTLPKEFKSKAMSENQLSVTKCHTYSKEEIMNILKMNCNNLSEQMEQLYRCLKMNELGWRLRFLACRKVEWLLPAFLSHGRAIPFGSSVNTFGNNLSDVDMTLDFENIDTWSENGSSKSNNLPSRLTIQKNVDLFASMMSHHKLCFGNVMRVLNARVPIIKCFEGFTDLECDISIQNMSGYYMSELLYLYGSSDIRVRPLVYSVRWWANQRGITPKTSPSSKITNFTLTLMVLFFLMNTEPKVVPTIAYLNKLSGKSFEVEGIVYSYIRDVNQIPESTNTQSLEELFEGFLKFYSQFNLKRNGFSLISGKIFNREANFPLFIQNPIEQSLNVARNTNYEEIERFIEECHITLNKLDYIRSSQNNFQETGGILTFVNSNEHSKQHREQKFDIKSIMMQTNEEANKYAARFVERDDKRSGKNHKNNKRVKVF